MDDVRYSGENKISINLVTVENKILEKMRRKNSRWLYSNLKMPFWVHKIVIIENLFIKKIMKFKGENT